MDSSNSLLSFAKINDWPLTSIKLSIAIATSDHLQIVLLAIAS